MKQTAIVNIYNFIRMSHSEPSRFLYDDFDTLRRQLILVKQYGFPGTYALKYDALMDEHYQALLKEYLDEHDEIGAWWEITEPLCRRAGVSFRSSRQEDHYDDRVDSAYCLGYLPEERKMLVDAYMADFYAVFGRYPGSIGSWVLDSVTMTHARECYGVEAACICRDQIGVDGFTLWGGWPNGVYYPSRSNGFVPASSPENQLDLPVFRLLGPDMIYNFEANVRPVALSGVFTLEPAWLSGRDPDFIRTYFSSMTDQDFLGVGYGQVGQENNFLWENIASGLELQLSILEELVREGRIRVETMAASARWFRKQYHLTPPLAAQVTHDWTGNGLNAQWYACVNYRLGLLGENGRLRIRDLFLYRDTYPCRYLHDRLRSPVSTFDALPVLFPQFWGGAEDRPFIRLMDGDGREPTGEIRYQVIGDAARAVLSRDGSTLAEFHLDQTGLTLYGSCGLHFDRLPVFREAFGREIRMEHEGFAYSFVLEQGRLMKAGADGVTIRPEDGRIRLCFGPHPGQVTKPEGVPIPQLCRSESRPVPPMPPTAEPGASLFPWGTAQTLHLHCHDAGQIRYTLDGSEPDGASMLYDAPIVITDDCVLKAKLFSERGESETASWSYRFGKLDIQLESPTKLDQRPVFCGSGIPDLLASRRGSTDYLDGRWRGTLEDIVVCGRLDAQPVESITMGFLSHHRSGIVYPKSVELYTGPDAQHLTLTHTVRMPEGPGKREIEKLDVVLPVNGSIGAFRIVARRHERMPQWCIYRGTETVFTMADNLILRPGREV